jgi:hypothetical protein
MQGFTLAVNEDGKSCAIMSTLNVLNNAKSTYMNK